MKETDIIKLAFIGAFIALALLFVLRIFAAFRFVILLVLAVLGLLLLLFFLKEKWQTRQKKKKDEQSAQGQINLIIGRCNVELEEIGNEIAAIKQSKKELEEQLKAFSQPTSPLAQQTQTLINGFTQEIALRQQKIEFYLQCNKQLSQLLAQQKLLDEVSQKQLQLEELKDRHYDDFADMESLKWTLEKKATYLQTIAELSSRVEKSNGVEEMELLQKQLKEILL